MSGRYGNSATCSKPPRKSGEARTEAVQVGIVGRVGHAEGARSGPEEFLAHQLADDREGARRALSQVPPRLPRYRATRQRPPPAAGQAGFVARSNRASANCCWSAASSSCASPSSPAPQWPARRAPHSAAWAAPSLGQRRRVRPRPAAPPAAGTSVSHSISVGRRPKRASAAWYRRPHRRGHRGAMVVDDRLRRDQVAGQVDFADAARRQRRERGHGRQRVFAMIALVDVQIVHVEQQPQPVRRASAAMNSASLIGVGAKAHISGHVFQQNLAPEGSCTRSTRSHSSASVGRSA